MSLEALSYRGTETLDKIQGTEQGILLGSSISLDFKPKSTTWTWDFTNEFDPSTHSEPLGVAR